jgi:hypothetical protein
MYIYESTTRLPDSLCARISHPSALTLKDGWNQMTPTDFRKLALSFPDVIESAHMHHPDFRVGGKIFATLGYPDENSAMVKLTRDAQAEFVCSNPGVFKPVIGAWGRQGSTDIHLPAAKIKIVRKAPRRRGTTSLRNGY